MKFLTVLIGSLFTLSAFACLDLENRTKICPNDIVFKGSEYREGAQVIAVNKETRKVTVRSLAQGTVIRESSHNLYVTRGCVEGVCVGDIVYKGSWYSNGAKVVAVNKSLGRVTVKSLKSGSSHSEKAIDLEVTNQCTDFDSER